jgi:hypothetical protein
VATPKEIPMTYESPAVVEIRMDAEIGSYQDDFDPSREQPAFIAPSVTPSVTTEARSDD